MQIALWTDFNLSTLNKMYDDILRRKCKRGDLPTVDEIFRTVWNEAGVETAIYDWTSKVVCEALKEAHEQLHQSDRIYMARACFGEDVRSTSHQPYKPDWAGIQGNRRRCGAERLQNLLPGDTKISSKWNVEEIKPGPVKRSFKLPEWMKPIKQIFTYCCELKTRYGYLITDEALVVVRVGPAPGADRNREEAKQTHADGLLEYRIITWDRTGQDQAGSSPSDQGGRLSVNLALWWLHLLAAKENKLQWEYPPLEQETLEDPGELQTSITQLAAPERSDDGQTESGSQSQSTADPVSSSFDPSVSFGLDSPTRKPRSHKRRRPADKESGSGSTKRGKYPTTQLAVS
ncbi:hypothetical protein H2201_000727 [Coniosporium apollinis]|uniref:Fungal-type protein kinase domain-containing protein n=1 Tax=Coniosporium apollinis TaxID=61459 RepID=A0ABQ9P460_9PEZI|nr:hypothetical protein H2201_000727 [Coniosporium apollinis]